jgi:hypothetical protein
MLLLLFILAWATKKSVMQFVIIWRKWVSKTFLYFFYVTLFELDGRSISSCWIGIKLESQKFETKKIISCYIRIISILFSETTYNFSLSLSLFLIPRLHLCLKDDLWTFFNILWKWPSPYDHMITHTDSKQSNI